MVEQILGVDSDYDDVVSKIANHRRKNLYPLMGEQIKVFSRATATRKYVSTELLGEIKFLSGSGHGNETEFIGNDMSPILQSNGYSKAEVEGKIIHLLACFTADDLGIKMVADGCDAFFGYNTYFTFYDDHIEYFLAPDDAIDMAIVEGKTAEEVHQIAVKSYTDTIDEMNRNNVNPTIIGFMMTNLNHLCSPVIDARWGRKNARLIT